MIGTKTQIKVRYGETDGMAITYHPNYLKWFEVGRLDLLECMGLRYRAIEAQDLGLPVLEANVRFLKPTFFDDTLVVETYIEQRPKARLRIDYKIMRETTLVATGYTVHAFISLKNYSPVKPPSIFEAALKPYFL